MIQDQGDDTQRAGFWALDAVGMNMKCEQGPKIQVKTCCQKTLQTTYWQKWHSGKSFSGLNKQNPGLTMVYNYA